MYVLLQRTRQLNIYQNVCLAFEFYLFQSRSIYTVKFERGKKLTMTITLIRSGKNIPSLSSIS